MHEVNERGVHGAEEPLHMRLFVGLPRGNDADRGTKSLCHLEQAAVSEFGAAIYDELNGSAPREAPVLRRKGVFVCAESFRGARRYKREIPPQNAATEYVDKNGQYRPTYRIAVLVHYDQIHVVAIRLDALQNHRRWMDAHAMAVFALRVLLSVAIQVSVVSVQGRDRPVKRRAGGSCVSFFL